MTGNRVLALDPGEKVGWARADVDEHGAWAELQHGISPLRDMAMKAHYRITAGAYDVVVMEDWRLYPSHARTMIGSNFPSVQFIGIIRHACWITRGVQLVIQGASVIHKEGGFSPAQLSMKSLRPELWRICSKPVKHDDGHNQDALLHLWAWTFKEKI